MSDYIQELNEGQRAAVLYNDGPSLVIAGAGSGKTRVLTYKIAYLLENDYQPWNILALTFTNKAAREMKERIARQVGVERARHLHLQTRSRRRRCRPPGAADRVGNAQSQAAATAGWAGLRGRRFFRQAAGIALGSSARGRRATRAAAARRREAARRQCRPGCRKSPAPGRAAGPRSARCARW